MHTYTYKYAEGGPDLPVLLTGGVTNTGNKLVSGLGDELSRGTMEVWVSWGGGRGEQSKVEGST